MTVQRFPETAIVLGSGCSAALGVPTMAGFMDKAFQRLAHPLPTDSQIDNTVNSHQPDAALIQYNGMSSQMALAEIQTFIHDVKGSAAYVRSDLLNIEELYGLAEMQNALDGKRQNDGTSDERLTPPQIAFNRAIFLLANDAGKELISDLEKYYNVCSDLSTIKRESQNEEPSGANSCTRYTNLVAYLSLASFRDDAYPVIIQFNWDLALDRALYVNRSLQIRRLKENERPLELGSEKLNEKLRDIYNKTMNDPQANRHVRWSEEVAAAVPWVDYSKALSGLPSLGGNGHDFKSSHLVLRPHGGINWSKEDSTDGILTNYYTDNHECSIKRYSLKNAIVNAILLRPLFSLDKMEGDSRLLINTMNISPPTWKKNVENFLDQWILMRAYFEKVRRIIFIGYSMPRTDLYFRHFLALALAKNNNAPRVYVWNPEILQLGPVHDSYLDLFAPLAREGRLFGLDGYFGDPALYDLNRVFHLAKRLEVS